MFHKNVLSSNHLTQHPTPNPAGLTLVSPVSGGAERPTAPVPNPVSTAASTPVFDLALIAARRCSSFFAEAAVLVLVFSVLDLLILKGHVELPWIAGAMAISLGLLAASVATEFTAQRWIKAHP